MTTQTHIDDIRIAYPAITVRCTWCGGDGEDQYLDFVGPCGNCNGTGKVGIGKRDPMGTVAHE